MFNLSDAEQQIIAGVLSRYIDADCEVFVFGSRAKLTNHRFSDLDMVVRSANPISLTTLALICDAFSESDLPFRVDFVDWDRIGDEFRSHIQGHWVPWCSKESENKTVNC